jgi:uncharacterized protein YfaS (alpha-2-macroglobulin family)
MSRPIRQIAAGSRVFLRIEIRDMSDDAQPLFSPAAGDEPELELRDPTGVVKVNYLNLTQQETGIWTYTYQTLATDVRGIWQARFRIVDSPTSEDYTLAQDAFELVT